MIPVGDVLPVQQIDLLNTLLAATQYQLQKHHSGLAENYIELLRQVAQLQKIVKNCNVAMHQIIGLLLSSGTQRPTGSSSCDLFTSVNSSGAGMTDLRVPDDYAISPLQEAPQQTSQLLREFSAERLDSKGRPFKFGIVSFIESI